MRTAFSFVLGFIALAAICSRANGEDADWLRGSGANLELRLQGEVVDSDGTPASNIQISGGMNRAGSPAALEPKINGNRFEIWIPVNRSRAYSFWLRAASANNERVAYKQLNDYELRQAAIDGLKLTLRATDRRVEVKVVEKGQPVARAYVRAELGFGVEVRSQTNADGVAEFGLLAEQQFQQLTAWTDDHRIGGYGFDRKPTRDPTAAEQTIELSHCREQTLRFVDESGSPVPDVGFKLNIATPPPDYNYIGTNENFVMTTDKNGEAVFKWFPDWEKAHYYAELEPGGWVNNGGPTDSDGVKMFKLKKAKTRKQIEGRVASEETSAGGFFVTLYSFQGEQAHVSDIGRVFTNSDGSFAVDVLPDATYCAYVLDGRWVGNIIAVVPYQALSDKRTPPQLTVAKGQPMEVEVTTGPEHKPYPNLTVSFQRDFDFNWREPGETQTGTAGPQWWVTTDAAGHAVTQTLPGKMRVSVYTPRWQTEKSLQVVAEKLAKVELYRKVKDERVVHGQLTLADGTKAILKGAAITIQSLDADYEDRQELRCDEQGAFSFKTPAESVGVFARTQDRLAAGSSVLDEHSAHVELRLQPTVDFDGQLLGEGDHAIAGERIQAYVRLEAKPTGKNYRPVIFDAEELETLTDGEGKYTLRRLPRETDISLLAGSREDSEGTHYLDKLRITSDEPPHRAVHRLKPTKQNTPLPPLTERFKSTMRDARLVGYRVLMILTDGDPNAQEFVDRNVLDYVAHRDAYAFLQVVANAGGDTPLTDADAAFLKEHGWPPPKPGHVIVYALDGDREATALGQLDFEPQRTQAEETVATFLHRYTPATVDSAEKWSAAFAQAKRTNKCVWARVSQKYCGPCWQLTRWLDDQRALLAKDYVFLKIDDYHDVNGTATAEKLTHGENHGIPYHAIFDENEKLLIDSSGSRGNVGSFNGEEGKKQLRKMLIATRHTLTNEEIEQLVDSVP